MSWSTRALALIFVAASMTGCLERKETIKVQSSGSVDVSLTFRGDQGEFDAARGDALPSSAPWTVTDSDVTSDDGKTQHVREATGRFARAEDVPETYGDPADPAPLRSRTSVGIETSSDGRRRFTFERHYDARAYAWRERLWKRAFPDEFKKELETAAAEAKGGPLPEPLLRRVVDALLVFEREKGHELLEESMTQVEPTSAARARLAAHAAFESAFAAAWKPEPLLEAINDPAKREALDARYRSETVKQAGKSGAAGLGDSGLDEKVGAAFARARRVLEVTEALGLHNFEVRVEMPAPIVLSDADAVEDDGRTAVFRFKGEDLRDRDHVLRVVAEEAAR
jgi:hypothetical protein